MELTDGDYVVSILGYDAAYIFVRLMSKNMYTTQFATKVEMNSQINQTVQAIDLSVNSKLSDYATILQMNSAINLKADSILSSVNKKFDSYDTSEEVSSKIEQKANSITSTVSDTYATKTQLNTAKTEIKQTTDNITSTVSNKAEKSEICSIISQSLEEILLKGNRVLIEATNFKLNKNGKVTCSDIDITGGQIKLKSDETNALLEVMHKTNSNWFTRIFPRQVIVKSDNSQTNLGNMLGYGMLSMNHNGTSTVGITGKSDAPELFLQTSSEMIFEANKSGVSARDFTKTSLESLKKNIVKIKDVLEIVKNTEVYEYNYKTEEDTDKKHIGFIIEDKSKGKYKTSDQILTQDRRKIRESTISGIEWRALQQILERLEIVERKIN